MQQGATQSPDSHWKNIFDLIYVYYGDTEASAKSDIDKIHRYLDENPDVYEAFMDHFVDHATWSLEEKIYLSTKILSERATLGHLRLVGRMLDQCLGVPPYFNTLFYCILRVGFIEGARIEGYDHETFKRDELWPRYRRFLDTHFRDIAFKPESDAIPAREKRVALVSPQIIGGHHAPSRLLLEYARTLRLKGGKVVLLALTELFPQTNEAPVNGAFIVNRLPDDPSSIIRVQYEGAELIRWRPSSPNFTPAKVMEAVLSVDAFDPGVVLSFGDWDMVGDLLARRYPVVHVPLTAGSAMSLGHLYLHTRQERFDPAPMDDQPGEYRVCDFMPWSASAAAEPRTRADLNIPEDAFCYAVVGNRLPSEIDRPFSAAVGKILKANRHARIVVIGSNYNGELEAGLPTHLARHVIPLPFQEDLLGVYGLCDAFLNPFRRGGGFSSFLAARVGLPIVTLKDCDVAVVSHLGDDLACDDHDAYITHAIRLMEDEEYRLEVSEATRTRVEETPLLFDAPEKLEAVFKQAMRRFDQVKS